MPQVKKQPLILGKMTTQQIADWFQLSKSTFSKHKKEYMQKLEKYAEIKPVYGGVQILEIYEEYYQKHENDARDDELYLKAVQNANEHLTSLSGMSRVLKKNNKDFEGISERMIQKRMRKAGIRTFGVTAQEDSYGLYGERSYVWAIKLSDNNEYRHMTVEEEKLFDELIGSYYSCNVDKVKKAAILENAFKHSEMTKEEYFLKKEMLDLNLFADVIGLFKRETGLQIVHATEHMVNCMMN